MLLRASSLVLLGVLAGCFDVPAPACGFACGENDECPPDYECDSGNRCRPIGQTSETCAAAPDDSDDDPRPEVRSTRLVALTQINIVFSALIFGVDGSTVMLARDDGERVAFEDIFNDGTGFVSVTFPALLEGRRYTLDVGGDIFDGDGYRLIPYHVMFDAVDQPPD